MTKLSHSEIQDLIRSAQRTIRPGAYYDHIRTGRRYLVLGFALGADLQELLVLFRGAGSDLVFARTAANFSARYLAAGFRPTVINATFAPASA